MLLKLSAKAKWNLRQILPFGIIWLVIGWIFMTVEYAATGNQSFQPEEAIKLSLPVLVFASIAVFLVGIVIGVFEVIFFNDLFSREKFSIRIFSKLFVYGTALLFIIVITYPIAASLELGLPLYHARVWVKLAGFLGSVVFLSTMFQMAFSLFLCFIYYGISQHLGHGALINFFTGRYNDPIEENRIFMFLDMRHSTRAAEKLGNKRYYELLSDYYSDFSDAIVNCRGEVYQYIGDEVVITWESEQGLKNNNAIECFYQMKKSMHKRSEYYLQKYDFVPHFKAGLHCGQVTTGEIGALKKEVFFIGDVLNVTARIQSLCNEYQQELLISNTFLEASDAQDLYDVDSLGSIHLKGRKEPIELYSLSELIIS